MNKRLVSRSTRKAQKPAILAKHPWRYDMTMTTDEELREKCKMILDYVEIRLRQCFRKNRFTPALPNYTNAQLQELQFKERRMNELDTFTSNNTNSTEGIALPPDQEISNLAELISSIIGDLINEN